MNVPRTPETLAEATKLLKRFAVLDGKVAAIEAARNKTIAAANAAADTQAERFREEREQIRDVIQPWWQVAAAELTKGKRKSIELGGCMIGSRSGRDSLAVEGDEKAIITSLGKRAWAKALLKVTTSLDRPALLKAVDGPNSKQLKALGLTRKPGAETFFVERAEQAGTQESVA